MKKILIIEDEAPIRETIADILELEGYDQRQAINGQDGIKIARSYMPDLIICDVMMPQLDGYGVLAELQKTPHTEKIPFIYLTARANRDDVRRGMSLGADDYITKPFNSQELLNAIERRLHKFDLLHKTMSEEVDQLRYYLNSTLPHELRTPLTALMGYLEWMTLDFEEIDPQEMKHLLGRMKYSANRLYRLVENHLLHAQLSAVIREGNIGEQLIRFGGCNKPQEVIEAAANRLAYKYNRIDDLMVSAEAAEVGILDDNLQKITEELVDNACKFSDPGSLIEVQGYADGGDYLLTVQDYGRGMTADHVKLIGPNRQFERQKYEQQGIGLGLTIVMQTAQIYRGEIKIDSQESSGTKVTVKLPLYTDDEE